MKKETLGYIIIGATTTCLITVLNLSSISTQNLGARTNQVPGLTAPLDCKGPTCTVWNYFNSEIGIRHGSLLRYLLSVAMNMHTVIRVSSQTAAPGATVCIDTTSVGEVVGFGEPYFGSPPITFNSDKTVVGDITGLSDISLNNNSPREKAAFDLHKSRGADVDHIYSSFTDQWNLQSCVNMSDTRVQCTLPASLQSGSTYDIVLKRTVQPFSLLGEAPIYGIKTPSIMTATATLTIDPNGPTSINCSEDPLEATLPSPSVLPGGKPIPTITVTPTPPPAGGPTAPPTSTPTFTPAPTPTGGDSGGDDIFQTDDV